MKVRIRKDNADNVIIVTTSFESLNLKAKTTPFKHTTKNKISQSRQI